MAVSDTLWEAVRTIRAYQRDGVIAHIGDPALDLVVRVMTAEQVKRDPS